MMQRFRDLPIRRKLMWSNMLTTGIALLAASGAFIAYELLTFRHNLVQQLSTQAEIIGYNSASALLFSDRDAAAQTLSALRAVPHIVAATIETPSGESFAMYSRDGARHLEDLPVLSGDESHRFADRTLVLWRPVVSQGELVGRVRIMADLEEMESRLNLYLVIIGLAFVASFLLSSPVSAQLQAIISKPILHLVERAREVSEKRNYALRAEVTSQDELGLLVRTFNEMLEQIQRRDVALQGARDDAEAANRAKDEFLAVVSHELRTPLTPILMWTNMLRRGNLDERTVLRGLEVIETSAKAQAQLIGDLLDVSRIISGKLRLDARPIDLAPVVEKSVESVRAAADAKEIRLTTSFELGVARVIGDPDRLQQVLWNLLSNAIRFTPKNGRVEVSVQRSGSNAEIAVRDTGEGIAPEFLPHVFERFKQADSTTSRPHGGLGLGLAIVRHLVELHGGTVAAESPGPGSGSVFRVRLPVMAVAPPVEEKAQPGIVEPIAAPEYASLEGLRVLVVDDEIQTCESVRVLLGQCGAQVRTALSAAEALRMLSHWTPDVLVSDIAMPGEDGYSLIRKVRARESETHTHIPAVALTAFARVEDRLRVLSEGFQMHLPKPVEPAELVTVVAGLAQRDRPRAERAH